MKTLLVKRAQLPALITKLTKKGAQPISVEYCVDVPLLKKRRSSGLTHALGSSVMKRSKINCFLNFDYEHSVNLERGRENRPENFKVKSTWYEHSTGLPRPVVRHKEDHSKLYLQLKVQKELETAFILSNGEVVEKSAILDLLPAPKKATRQNLAKEVCVIVASFNNLISIVANNCTYQVV